MLFIEDCQVRFIVGVEPAATPFPSFFSGGTDKRTPDAQAPCVRVHTGVQQHGVSPAVPDDVHESDQGAFRPGGDSEQAVPGKPLVPRDRDDLVAERCGMESIELLIADRLKQSVLHCAMRRNDNTTTPARLLGVLGSGWTQ